MAQSSHRTAERHSVDGIKRAHEWHEDVLPSEAILAMCDDLNECKGFTETNSKIIVRKADGNGMEKINLVTESGVVASDVMRVLALHDATIEVWFNHPTLTYVEWRVALPVE